METKTTVSWVVDLWVGFVASYDDGKEEGIAE